MTPHENLNTPHPPNEARAARLQALRQAALALRARLRFHEQCGIEVYPFIAPPTSAVAAAKAARQARPAVSPGRASDRPTMPRPQASRPSARPVARQSASSRPAPAPEALERVREAIRACGRCASEDWSAGPRVLGRGSAGARLLILGDYAVLPDNAEPGPELCFGTAEDEMLGKMLDKVLGLSWNEVHVTNLCKCCPTERQARAACRNCLPHFLQELASVRPELVCVMGDLATSALLGAGVSLFARRGGKMHGFEHEGTRYPVMVTFHPRFLARTPDMKRAAMQDLEAMRAWLARPR